MTADDDMIFVVVIIITFIIKFMFIRIIVMMVMRMMTMMEIRMLDGPNCENVLRILDMPIPKPRF